MRALCPALLAGLVLVAGAALPAGLRVGADTPARYQANDYSGGRVLSILPPGENGRITAAELLPAEGGSRPAGNNDQRPKYAGLLYGSPALTDSQLGNYYDDESFGIQPQDITGAEALAPASGSVTIYRDTHDVPHIYGSDVDAMSFGAGYAAAEDRLFFIDVLRHYGAGTLSAFLGPTCSDEQMDHDQLALAAYTVDERDAQVDNGPKLYGAAGQMLKDMVYAYVAGINSYVTKAQADASLIPADYGVTSNPVPQTWQVGDIIAIAGLVGGIFGKGGGVEDRNAALLQALVTKTGGDTTAALHILHDLHQQNDPQAPTTITDRSFPYEIPGTIDPATTALPDDAQGYLKAAGQPTSDEPDCTSSGLGLPLPIPAASASRGASAAPATAAARAAQVQAGLRALDAALHASGHSNALLVDAEHSASGHPLAVFGPQVAYFAPEILMEEDLHAPDFAEAGASFPGTNFIVELGRGEDYAWSATSASTDVVDVRLELLCTPPGGPQPGEHFYLFNGRCMQMEHQNLPETATPTAAELAGGAAPIPRMISHDNYVTVHGVVQGFSTAMGGKPVAVVLQRSTYGHEADSAVGFVRWGIPSLTHDAASWMIGAEGIQYTFNWFYVDSHDIAYYVSGHDPIRPSNVDPYLPTWGTGQSEWQGFLADDAHPHEIDPPQGYFTSWNNKPAPGFSAADDQFSYGLVYRSQSLDRGIAAQLDLHGGRLTRANLVSAMEDAATVDLSGRSYLGELLPYLNGQISDPKVSAMLGQLSSWLAEGAHRIKASPGDTQYRHAAAIATMDQLHVRLVEALFDPLLAAGGVQNQDGVPYQYDLVEGSSTPFANTPHGLGDSQYGSSYDGGYESYILKAVRELRGEAVAEPFGPDLAAKLCSGGLGTCKAAIIAAVTKTDSDLVAANGGSTDPATWTASPSLANLNAAAASATPPGSAETLPQYDSIAFRAVGIVGQQNIDWQNRPTFQQVVEFPSGRPSTTSPTATTAGTQALNGAPNTAAAGTGGAGAGLVALIGGAVTARRRRRRGPPGVGSQGLG